MTEEYIWLSYPLAIDGPRPPAIPAPKLESLYSIEKDKVKVQILTAPSHIGTHIDAPGHVFEDGLTLLDFAPEEFIFSKPVVAELSADDGHIVTKKELEPLLPQITEADIALIRFGYSKIRHKDPERFTSQCPGFGVDAAKLLKTACPNLKGLGVDVPSVLCIAHLEETMPVHNILLEGKNSKFLVIEEMKLDEDLPKLCEVRLQPWLVSGMDSAPCSIVGLVD